MVTFKSGKSGVSSGLETSSSFSGKFIFIIMRSNLKISFLEGNAFLTRSKDSGGILRNRSISVESTEPKAFHTAHVIPHVRFYITAATSAGQNTNRMHRLLFDTSTS